jgi:hypothetical protein
MSAKRAPYGADARSLLAGALIALLPVLAAASEGTPAPAEARGAAAELIDDVGLWKSSVDPEELGRGEAGLEDPPQETLDDAADSDAPRGEPFIAPIPFRSPSLGWGGALAGGYIFRIDKDDDETPPSTASVAGFGTENESFGGIVSFRGHLARDLWRVASTFSLARVNYDFFGIGSDAGERGEKIEIEADLITSFVEVLRRLPDEIELFGEPFYLGPSIAVSRTENSLGGGSLPPDVSTSELDETRVALGVHVQRDSRDDNFYPEDGSLADFAFSFSDDAVGSDFDYRVFDVSYRRFDSLWEDGVLAGRVFGRFTEGDVPFTDLSQHDLRGYERGRYRDRMHMAAELELRQQLFWRFGGAVFAGLGQVAPALDDFDGNRLLWSAGLGLRFRLTEQNRMNYRSDIAWGRDGFEFYFSITEAF